VYVTVYLGVSQLHAVALAGYQSGYLPWEGADVVVIWQEKTDWITCFGVGELKLC